MPSLVAFAAGTVLLLGADEITAPAVKTEPAKEAVVADRPDPEVARRVANAISTLGLPEARGRNLPETSKAIDELVKIGPPAVPQLVRAILTGNESEAAYSALVLDKIGPPAVVPIRTVWNEMDERSRWKLMRFRGQHDYGASLDFALTSLDSKDKNVRSQAIRYLGKYKETKARSQLLKLLNADAPSLRWKIVDALTAIGGDEVVRPFMELLAPDSWAARGEGREPPDGFPPPWWPDGRPQIVESLHVLNAKRAAPALLELLRERGTGKAYLGQFILPALGDFGFTSAVPELRSILATDPAEYAHSRFAQDVPCLAAAALWKCGDSLGRAVVVELLLEGNGGPQGIAFKTAREIGDRSDIWVMATCLDYPGWEFKKHAVVALEALTGITNRAPGWAAPTEHDAPLWRNWYLKHKGKLASMTFPRRTEQEVDRRGVTTTIASEPPLSKDAADALWGDLASLRRFVAMRAMVRLLETPNGSIHVIKSRLRPIPNAAPDRIGQLVKNLDEPIFDVREKARVELEWMAESAVPQLDRYLDGPISVEAALQIRRVLERAKQPINLQAFRTLAVLEAINSEEARGIVSEIASGNKDATLTIEAVGNRERMNPGM
jgi:HEAT repeat protein